MVRAKKMKFRLTRDGRVFLIGTGIILLVAISYYNNLAYLFSFLLISVLLVAIVRGVNQVSRIELLSVRVQPGFAGDQLDADLTFKNNDSEELFALEGELVGSDGRLGIGGSERLPAEEIGTIPLKLPGSPRGSYRTKTARIGTSYPLGLFRLLRTMATDTPYYVYPAPVGARPFPPALGSMGGEDDTGVGNGDDYSGHLLYMKGGSQRHVDWKLLARGGPMMLKEFKGGSQTILSFSWHSLNDLEIEARISQLAEWINRAHLLGLNYCLQMPEIDFGPDVGVDHYHQCMRFLATFSAGK